ncbi:Zn-dependent alcohol dehydrogenase [Rhizobium sp. A37_96]
MKAAIFHGPHQRLAIEDVSISNPGPHEVLIRTAAAGLCHSDLHFMEGLYKLEGPAVLGHEVAGIVEKVGTDVTYVQPGDHVITCLSVFCGQCDYCTTGRPFNCDHRHETERKAEEVPRISRNQQKVSQLYDLGGFAEQMLVHEHAVVKIRRDMPLDLAALIGCAVTTGMGAVINTARIDVGSTVAVIGCGGVGLNAINGAFIAGAREIIAIDVQESKLNLARNFGATQTINAATCDPVEAIMELTNGGVEYAFEALGLKKTAEQAYQMLRPSGLAVIIGMVPQGQKIEINASSLLYERRLMGSNMGSNRFRVDMPRYIDFYMSGRLKLDQMVSKRIALAQINEGFDDMKTGNFARSVIVFPT